MSYWENRKAREMYQAMESAEDTAKDIRNIYAKASRELNYQIALIYERYQNKFDISEAEAKLLLNQEITPERVKELSKKLAELKGLDANEVLKELESPAYRKRIERLQQLQDNVDKMMKDVYKQEKDVSTDHYIEQYGNSYYHEIYDIKNATGLDYSFGHVDHKELDRIVGAKWSGKSYSQRIWGNTQTLAQDLKEQLAIAYLTGKQEKDIAMDIAAKYATGAANARRLVRTESAYISNQACAAADEDAGIDKYRICAVLDLRTSEICRSLDGNEYEYKDMEVGVNYPPFHPYCRTTVLSVLDDECMEGLTRRARDPVTGEVKKFPASMTYKEWYEKEVKAKVPKESKSKDNKPKEEQDNNIVNIEDRAREAVKNAYEHKLTVTGANLLHWDDFATPDRISLKGMDENIAEATISRFEKLSSKYETNCDTIKCLPFDWKLASVPAETEVQAQLSSASITFNRTVVKDQAKFTERMKAAVAKGQFPQMDESVFNDYVITHEYAHSMMDFSKGTKSLVDADLSKVKDARKEVQGLYDEYLKEYKALESKQKSAELKALTSMDSADWDDARKLSAELKDLKISGYAEKSIDEFWAEAFTDAEIGNNPSPYSIKVKDVATKYFGKPAQVTEPVKVVKKTAAFDIETLEKIEKNRGADIKQYEKYKKLLGKKGSLKNIDRFRELKYNNPEEWEYTKGLYKYLNEYPESNEKIYKIHKELNKLEISPGTALPANEKRAYILPSGKRDSYHIMKRMKERNITDDELRSIVSDAKIMFAQRGGRYLYVSDLGEAVLIPDKDNGWIFKTAWKKEDFDESALKMMEVIKENE